MLLWLWIGCLLNGALYEEKSQDLANAQDLDGDGFSAVDDCDDTNESIYPGAPEQCDQRDNDCDGTTDEEAIDAIEWFIDQDADGFGDDATVYWACEGQSGAINLGGDCNDALADIHPDALEVWYDGTDQNCDDWSDFDADADGQDHIDYGGSDCNDLDSSVYEGAPETWTDIHTDNDCDGDTQDATTYDLTPLSPLTGIQENARLGAEQLALPPEWSGSESIIVVAAPGTHDDNGEVYALRPSALMDMDSIEEAEWIMTGQWDDHLLGTGMARLGNPTGPITAISAPGTLDSRVYLFDEPLLDTDPDHPNVILEAENVPRVGLSMATGHDHDGDGMADLVLSRGYNTSDADAIAIFYEADVLPNVLSIEDADVTLTVDTTSARISMTSLGDVNGDGLSDLGVGIGSDHTAIPGGLIVTWSRSVDEADIEDASATLFYGPMAQFGPPMDADGDGHMEVLAGPDHLYRFSLPLVEGTVDWSTAEAAAILADPDGQLSGIHTDLPAYGDYAPVAVASAGASDGAGQLFLLQPDWTGEIQLGEQELSIEGLNSGDGFSASMSVFESDDMPNGGFLVGSPGSNANGENSGALYRIPAPE